MQKSKLANATTSYKKVGYNDYMVAPQKAGNNDAAFRRMDKMGKTLFQSISNDSHILIIIHIFTL